MKMIERWEWIEEGMGIVLLPVCRGHEFNDRFGIFNHMSVTIDDRMAFEWHKAILLSLPNLYVINRLYLVKTSFAARAEIFEVVDSLGPSAAEPFSIEPIVGAVFSEFQQHFIDWFSIRAVGREENTVALFVKNIADDLDFSLTFMRCIVEQNWRVVHDGVRRALVKCLKSLLHVSESRRLDIVTAQIIHRRAALHRCDAFAGEIFRAVDISAQLLKGESRGHRGGKVGDKDHASEHPDHGHDSRQSCARHLVGLGC